MIALVSFFSPKFYFEDPKLIAMNQTDENCSLDITNKFYTSLHLRRFLLPLAVLNCIIDSCLRITSVGGSALLLVAAPNFLVTFVTTKQPSLHIAGSILLTN